ncbi:hypothetical protein DH2020_036273 [Rehmannia glutinosa]|uniref:Reticulon-like protein n=1 Tax=Rehmannia glutinosa TaxID=99300 RepID=A0ABR0V6N8_REHGL
MADHHQEDEKKHESLMDKISDKIHGHGSSSSSSSESEDEKPSSFKAKVYRLFGREKPLHRVLGGGKPADVFLWRDKKVSAGLLGGATALWVFFDVLEYNLITFVCHSLILVLAVLFLWSNATTFIKKSPPRIPEVCIPEKPVLQFVSSLRIELNQAFAALRDISSGQDLKKFLAKYEDQVDSFAEKAVAELKKQYAVFDAKVLSKIPRGPLKDKKWA